MRIVALEIPEEPQRTAPWLDRQLIGLDLADLVAQLSVVEPGERRSLDAVLGEELPAVLRRGLTELSPDRFAELLDHPRLLLDLQTRILMEGGDYWDNLQAATLPGDAASARSERAQPTTAVAPHLNPTTSTRRRWVVATFALAASVALVIAVQEPPKPSGWGFERSGLFASDMPSDEYLLTLSEAAEEWFNKTPETRQQLRTRLEQFRDGCDALLAAEHEPLSGEEREWLLDRCQVWKDGIDARLNELATTRLSTNEVQQRSDGLIQKLITALRNRAAA